MKGINRFVFFVLSCIILALASAQVQLVSTLRATASLVHTPWAGSLNHKDEVGHGASGSPGVLTAFPALLVVRTAHG